MDFSFTAQTSQTNGPTNLGFAISQQATTRVAIFCAGAGSTGIRFSKITNGTWGTITSITATFDFAPSTNASDPQYMGCTMTPDATRLIVPVGAFGGNCELYWANATGLLGSSTSLSFKRITSTTRNYMMTSVTPDGSRLLVSVYNANNGLIYYSDWNGTDNYGALVSILDTTARNYFGVYISSDKQKILYAAGTSVYWSVWNGTNYPVGTEISISGIEQVRSVAIFGYGTIDEFLISTPWGNVGAQYATWNGTGYNALSTISYSAIPQSIVGYGLAVDSTTIYLAGYNASTINVVNVTSSPIPLLQFKFDTSTNNTGTYTNSTGTATKCAISTTHTVNTSGSLYFDGSSNQNFKINNPPTLSNTTGLTFSVWVKHEYFPPPGDSAPTNYSQRIFDLGRTDIAENRTIISIMYYNNKYGATYNVLYINDESNFPYYILDTGNDYRITINDNIWHHYCLTISPQSGLNGIFKLYVDNLLVLTTPPKTYPAIANITSWLLGQSNYTTDAAASAQQRMYMNNFEYYAGELTASQVSAIYTPIANSKLSVIKRFNYWGLILYYPFENDILNYATGTGVSDASTNFGSLSTTVSIFPGKKSYLVGSDNEESTTYYFQGKAITLYNSGFTVACWMRLTTIKNSSKSIRIFDIGISDTVFDIVLNWYTDGLRYYLRGSPADSGGATTRTIRPDTQSWHHYCMVYDKTYLIVYFDGICVLKVPFTTWNKYNILHNSVSLGRCNDNNGYTTNAYYNSFMVFNRPIQECELGLIMGSSNQIVNGGFNSFMLSNNTDANVNGYWGLKDNLYLSQINSISNWNFITNDTTKLIASGSRFTTNSPSPQHYFICSQSGASRTSYLYQHVYLEPGVYLFKYIAHGRQNEGITTYFDPPYHKLTSSIIYQSSTRVSSEYYLVSQSEQTLTSTAITKYVSSPFTVTSSGKFTVLFKIYIF